MKKIVLFYLFVLLSLGLYAQNLTISGRVISADDNQSLPGVSVILKGTTTGTITNLDGNFTLLNVPSNATLQFSFIGMRTQEVPVAGKTTINVTLANDVFGVDEVVVVGYGVQKKSLVTGAIAKVDGNELRKASDMRVTQALQGKTAGVVISSNSGQPGDQISVRVRGTGTNGDAEPLYIIDGLPMSGAGTDFLNSGDIESIEVLKDAASAAIYGARGANGVVLITTKTGKKGTKLAVNYDGYLGVQNPWKKQSLLNSSEYVMLINEATLNAGQDYAFSAAQIAGFTADTDWQDQMFYYDAPKQNHALNFSGGSDKIEYSSSINYFKQDGIVAKGKSNFERMSYRLSTNADLGAVKVGGNLNLAGIVSRGVATNDRYGTGLNQALNMPPIIPIYNEDGTYATPEQFGIGMQEITNPIALMDYTTNSKTRTNKLIGGVFGELSFGKLFPVLTGLTFRTSFGGEYAMVNNDNYTPLYYIDALHFTVDDQAGKSINIYSRWNFENVLTYDKTIDEHHFTLMAGTTAFKDMWESIYGSKKNVIFDDFEHSYLDNATDPLSASVGGGASEHTVASIFGRLNYDLKDRYMFAATLRRDGSSRFGAKNKYGYFPSASIGWVLSRENFLTGLSNTFDLVKIRASWGQNGNENIGNFGYTSIIGNGAIYYFGDSKTQYNGTAPNSIANPSLKWETSEQTNFGIDLAKAGFRATLDYYIKTTKDWLVTAPVPMMVGNSAPTVNGGSVRNSGFEAEFGYRKKFGGLNFDASINGAINKNEVLDIQNSEKRLQGGDGGFGQSGIIYAEVGSPMGVFYGIKTDGIFQTAEEIAAYKDPTSGALIQPKAKPGDIKFIDFDKDGVISDGDRQQIGSPYPDFTGGLNLNLEWKGFDLNMFWYAALGQEIFRATRRYDMNFSNYTAEWLDRWTGPGTSNHFPRVTFVDDNVNMKTVSDFFIEDGSFIRLRNTSLGYTIPKSITSYAKVNRVRLYVSAENLLTLTPYKGYDPEIGGGVFSNGIDRGIYPQARSILGGVNITF